MNVHVVSASAGTGKTYRLAGEVTRALIDGSARPEGVVAITFTKKAAAELESRIRTDLVRAGRGDLAARVRDGYLGTVHSVCERLLREHALAAGHSPFLEPIAEAQRESMFSQALAAVLAGREVVIEPLATRFGLEDWESRTLRRIVDLARENGLSGPALRAAGDRSVATLLAYLPPVATGEAEYRTRLAAEAGRADERLRALDRPGAAARTRREVVTELVRALARPRFPPWADLVRVTKQKWTVDEQPAVQQLCEAVADHLSCDRLRDDLEELTRALFGVAADALDSYARVKHEARVVDFQDMLALAASLLDTAGAAGAPPASGGRPGGDPAPGAPASRGGDVAAALTGELDLVVVDEFQDTSPMQLAVVSALARLARRCVWVGDRKQAIFGFQGSDPVLMGAAMDHALGGRKPEFLSLSWRSRPPLVAFTSELFARVLAARDFTDEEVRITTPEDRPDPAALAGVPVLECWSWEGGEEVEAVASGVAALLADPPPVRDRETGAVRPARRRDVAVLARRGKDCRAIAAALGARGVPALVKLGELSSTPEAVLLAAALALVADPADGIAAMDVSYLAGRGAADPDAWLTARLAEAARDRAARAAAKAAGTPEPLPTLPFSDDARVTALRALHDRASTVAPAEALDAAIATAGLLELLRTWPDPARRLANVEAVREAARGYEELCRVRRCAGTVAGLVEHLATLAELKRSREKDEDDQDLQALPGTEDAVVISTWHSAKGLEWPIVVLGSLGFVKDRDVWPPAVARPPGFDPTAPLAGRWIRYWPWPYGKFSKGLELDDRVANGPEAAAVRGDEEGERVRLLYVAFTRARDRLVLAAGTKKGAPLLDGLAPLRDGAGAPVLELPLGAGEGMGVARVGGLEVPCRVRVLSGAAVEAAPAHAAPRPWYDGAAATPRPRELVTPSCEPLAGAAPARVLSVVPLAGRAPLAAGSEMGPVGDAVHAFLAADRWRGEREAVAARLLAAHGVVGVVAPSSLVRASDALRGFLDARYPDAAWRREWPIRARLDEGGHPRLVQGEVDLFLELPDGFVLVDHKSFPGDDRERDHRIAEEYAPQLGWYARVLARALGKPLRSAFIHLPIRGEMAEVALA